MSAVTFDALKFTKTLEKAGLPAVQAEAISEAFKEASGEAELATKKDIALAVAEIKGEMNGLKGEMNVMKWMLGTVLAVAIANFVKQYF